MECLGLADIGLSAGEFDGRVPASSLTCYGFRFRAEGFWVSGLEFRASALRSRVWSPAFGVYGLGAVCLHSGLSPGHRIRFTQRVHVGIWYILRAQRGSHIPTLRAEYIPYNYMDPLG